MSINYNELSGTMSGLPIYLTSSQIDRIVDVLRAAGNVSEDQDELIIADSIIEQWNDQQPEI